MKIRRLRRGGLVLVFASFVLGGQVIGASRPARFLTGPSSGDPVEIAQRFVAENRASYRLEASDLSDQIVESRYVSRNNGVTHVYLHQRLEGIEVYNAVLNVNVARDGRIINVGNRFVTGLAIGSLRTPRESQFVTDLRKARAEAIQSGAARTAHGVRFLPDGRAIGPSVHALTGEPLAK